MLTCTVRGLGSGSIPSARRACRCAGGALLGACSLGLASASVAASWPTWPTWPLFVVPWCAECAVVLSVQVVRVLKWGGGAYINGEKVVTREAPDARLGAEGT